MLDVIFIPAKSVQLFDNKSSDGRWEARATGSIDYRTGKPKRISVYGKTKSEVIGKLRELEYDIHNRKAIDPTSTKLVDWLTYWLETYKKNNIKQSTYVSYRGYIDRHVAAGFPVMKLKDLTSSLMSGEYSVYQNAGQYFPILILTLHRVAYLLLKSNDKLTVENLSAKTILNIHRCLHEALKQAVLEHYLTFNPSDAVVLPKREKPEIEILTREEQAKLIQASYQFRYGIFIRLTLTTGMRLGEVLGLKWENIDLR